MVHTMEGFDLKFRRSRKPGFDEVPPMHRRRLLGVDYVHLRGLQGGDLFVTRWGWPLAESLLPDRWFVGQRFCKVGRALAGATGAVYHVPVPHPRCSRLGLVVKFSRFAQDVAVTLLDEELHHNPLVRRHLDNAQFLDPFTEFANLIALRSSPGPRVFTCQPLGIYSPPTRYADWELGRSAGRFSHACDQLLAAQAPNLGQSPIAYDPERIYVLLYRWIEGIDTEEACRRQWLGEEAMQTLSEHVRRTLLHKGFLVLDHKPKHVIVRPRRQQQTREFPVMLRERSGWPLWAVIDYELLLPIDVAEK